MKTIELSSHDLRAMIARKLNRDVEEVQETSADTGFMAFSYDGGHDSFPIYIPIILFLCAYYDVTNEDVNLFWDAYTWTYRAEVNVHRTNKGRLCYDPIYNPDPTAPVLTDEDEDDLFGVDNGCVMRKLESLCRRLNEQYDSSGRFFVVNKISRHSYDVVDYRQNGFYISRHFSSVDDCEVYLRSFLLSV